MTKNPKKRRIYVNLAILTFLIVGTLVAIKFAKGYRPNLKERSIQGTGLLSLTSYPKTARVTINDKLTTVTDDKLYLVPSTYTVKIEKDGFHPWTKSLPIKAELVTSADARLFPIITATSPITFYQASNASLNPDGTKIAYVLKNSPQETTNGLYIHSISNNLLGSSSNLQIAENTPKDYSNALLIWSPDSTQILAVFTEKNKISTSYLLSTKSLNSRVNSDVTLRLPTIITEWQDQYAKINQPILSLFPSYLSEYLTKSAYNVYFSPDKEKVFYTAKENIELPKNEIGALLPNLNSTTETRSLQKGKTYLFDLKEGTNYQLDIASNSGQIAKQLILSASATPSASLSDLMQLKAQTESYYTNNLIWYSNSRQIIANSKNGVQILDYDGQNLVDINSTIPLNQFVIPSADGTKLIVLTNINQRPDTYNLISFDLK